MQCVNTKTNWYRVKKNYICEQNKNSCKMHTYSYTVLHNIYLYYKYKYVNIYIQDVFEIIEDTSPCILCGVVQ